MDRQIAVVLWAAVFVRTKRTDTGLVSIRTPGVAADVHGQLGKTGSVQSAVVIDLHCTANIAGSAGRRAVVRTIEERRHIGPLLTTDLVEKARGPDSVMALVLEAVCAAGDWGPVGFAGYVDGHAAMGLRGIGAGPVCKIPISTFGDDLPRDRVPVILLHGRPGDVRAQSKV